MPNYTINGTFTHYFLMGLLGGQSKFKLSVIQLFGGECLVGQAG